MLRVLKIILDTIFKIFVSFVISLVLAGFTLFLLFPFVGFLSDSLTFIPEAVTKTSLFRLFSLYGIIIVFLNLLFIFQKKLQLVGLFLLLYLGTGMYISLNIPTVTPKSNKITFVEQDDTCDANATLIRAKECTVLVNGLYSHGSGFVLTPSGYVVTNYHVIEDSEDGYINVWTQKGVTNARIVGFKEEFDIAVIKLDKLSVSSCNWASSDSMSLAENVYAVGWPNDPSGDSTITKGIFSRYVTFEDSIEMIQTDTPINPGNSGGPLVDSCGVVGINTSKISWIYSDAPSEGLGYSIASDFAASFVTEIISSDNGNVRVPTIKIGTESLNNESKENGTSDGTNRNTVDPNSNVTYDFEEVLFWEQRLSSDREIRESWEDNLESEYIDANKLSVLLKNLDRMINLADLLWDGYTNSKITYQQAYNFEKEYWELNNEAADLTIELNYEGTINSYNACVDSWQDLEHEYDADFSEEIEECKEYLE